MISFTARDLTSGLRYIRARPSVSDQLLPEVRGLIQLAPVRIGALPANKIIRIESVGQTQYSDCEISLKQEFNRTLRRALSRRVGIVIHHDLGNKSCQHRHLLRPQAGAARSDHVLNSVLMQAETIEITFDDDHPTGLTGRRARQVETVEDERFRGREGIPEN